MATDFDMSVCHRQMKFLEFPGRLKRRAASLAMVSTTVGRGTMFKGECFLIAAAKNNWDCVMAARERTSDGRRRLERAAFLYF